MKTVFKLMLFSIMLNFATGIMLVAVIDYDGNPVFHEGMMMGLTYDENLAGELTGEFNESLNPEKVLEDSGDAVYRLLDTINLGFIGKFIKVVNNYMFGFIILLSNMFKSFMPVGLGNLLFGVPPTNFGILKGIITVGYVIGAWSLWSGKSLTK